METDVAYLGAASIARHYDRYRGRFKDITARAGLRFRGRDWQGMHADAVERISFYKTHIDETVQDVQIILSGGVTDRILWETMKTIFARETASYSDHELAETWFNSVTRRVFSTVGVDTRIEFGNSEQRCSASPGGEVPACRIYGAEKGIQLLFESLLRDYSDQLPFRDIPRDARLITERVKAARAASADQRVPDRIEMIRSVFFRGMSAYIVGRIVSGIGTFPLVIAVLHGPAGVFTDAVLFTERDTSILFSFTRSSFHVETDCPSGLVHFLKSMLPKKKIAELYMAIGYSKHGKTELYRDLQQHLTVCGGEQFEMAPGQRGMVMEVFGMPGYDIVFKLIKDRFAYPKQSTRREVMGKYDLVFQHERAGRLVEALSFEHLAFDRCNFSDDFLNELLGSTAATVHADMDRVTLDHAYVERRVKPLDLFLKEADPAEIAAAVIDFGNAIKELAKSNIFPGDFLLKNFGVTRFRRVVFYDYDELCLLTECRFRKIPPPRDDDDVFSGDPWYYIGENDVFPEEFKTFMGLNAQQMEIFMSEHADLFGVDFWQEAQQAILAGQWCHIFPYPADRRFDQPADAVCDFWDMGCRLSTG